MEENPHVVISILNYNDGKDTLKNCLGSLFSIDYPNYSVIVTDNASSDGSLEEAASSFPQVTFIRSEKNLGFAGGNNLGIRAALEKKADYVLLLNNDTLVEKNFLSQLIQVAQKDGNIGVLCPQIFEGDRRSVWFSGGKIDWLKMKSLHVRKEIKEVIFDSDFISGCAMLIKAAVFQKIGLLDEAYFLYWEDVDFSVRARRAGFRIAISPSSRIYHLEQSNAHSVKKTYHLVLSGLIFFKKNAPGYLRCWLFFYVRLRILKNCLDRALKKGEVAEAVHKAYKEFQNVDI